MATSAFGKAFRAARDAGEKEFTFNGAKYTTKYAEEESPKKMSMAAQGLTAKGEQAPLRNIPVLPNKVEKEDLDEKGRIGNALMRAEVGEELPVAKYAPKKFGKENLKISSPADEGLEKYIPRKVSTQESLSPGEEAMKRGGKITHYKSASAAVKAAEKRGDKSITVKFNHRDGIAQRGHTKGRMR